MSDNIKSKQDIAREANKAANLPHNKTGPDLSKAGKKNGDNDKSDLA